MLESIKSFDGLAKGHYRCAVRYVDFCCTFIVILHMMFEAFGFSEGTTFTLQKVNSATFGRSALAE